MTDSQRVLELLDSINVAGVNHLPERCLKTDQFVWTLNISGVDKLGVLLSQLKLEAMKMLSNSIKKQAELITKKLTYLDEGFKLLEHDSDQQTFFLRGSSPQKKNDKTFYFEIVLKGGRVLSLDHYEFDRAAGHRRLFPANLSRDTFERIVEDLQMILA